MAIGRISGAMLYENQERQGIDLRFEGDLIYLDVNDNQTLSDGRVGIKTSSPQYDFDINGDARAGNIVISGNSLSHDTANGNLNLNTTGTGRVQISGAYYLPNTDGNVGYALITDGNASVSFQPISTTLSLAGDDGNEDISLLTDSLAIVGGEAILTTLNDAVLTINANISTTTQRGVASFETNNFSVTDGEVSVRDDYVQGIVGGMVTGSGAGHQNISINYNNTTQKIVFTVSKASTTTLGVAQFDTNNFVVTDGVVTINNNLAEDITGALLSNSTQSGISISYDSTINKATFTVNTASTTTKGIASFNDDDFDVADGAVNLADSIVKQITTDSGNLTPITHSFSIIGGEGIDVTHANTEITVTGENASASNKGIASFSNSYFAVSAGDVAINDSTTTTKGISSFDSNNFTVSSGKVTSKSANIGTSVLDLGSTLTSISGLQSLTVDNIQIDGNEISSIDNNGNISLNPNGSGIVTVNGSRITNVDAPTDGTDAVNKNYVDNYFINFNDDRIVSGNTSVIASASNVVITVNTATHSYFDANGYTIGNLSISTNGISSLNSGVIDISTTSAINLPSGTTAQRPASPAAGDIRFNTTTMAVESYDGTAWIKLSNNIKSQIIIPDGTSNSYTLDQDSTTDSVIVSLNGVIQSPAAYSVSGTSILFVETPQVTDIIDVRFLATIVATRIASSTAPTSATATGNPGQIAYDNSYIYVCVAQNTWLRAQLNSW